MRSRPFWTEQWWIRSSKLTFHVRNQQQQKMKLRRKKLSLLSNVAKMIFATMFWAELSLFFFCKSFTYSQKKKKIVHVIYRLFIAMVQWQQEKMQQFSTIQSEVNIFRVFAFFYANVSRYLQNVEFIQYAGMHQKSGKKSLVWRHWKSFFFPILHSATNDRIVEQ